MLIIDDKILKQQPIAEGGEAIIYNYQDKILKVYKPVVDKKEKLQKVSLLINKNLPNSVIKPLELAYNQNQQFIGYIMNKVEGEEFKRLSNRKFIKSNKITVKDIVEMLESIKDTLIQLHKNNVYIGDLNDCNILFDKNNKIYFIDVDSWAVDNVTCKVCMDTFKDPLLVADHFNAETDAFAYSVIAFKSLTKIHPFGGTMDPDINIIDRMKKKISVIGNNNVVVPKTIDGWGFIYPKLVEEMKEVFNTNKRFIIEKSLEHFKNHLKLCSNHNDFYYSKFNECPVCNIAAKVIEGPVKVVGSNGIPFILLFGNGSVRTIISENSYLNDSDYVVHIRSDKKWKFNRGIKTYFSNDGSVSYSTNDTEISVLIDGQKINFNKQFKSRVAVIDNTFYYVNSNNSLTEVAVSKSGNASRNIAKVSINNLFEVVNKDHYFICNQYDGMKIFNVDGYNYSLQEGFKIQEYGIHFDTVSKRWLFVCEDDKGVFRTYVFEKNKLIYFNDSIKYTNDLGSMCFNNNVIFKAGDKAIKGFSFDKNTYKDFGCEIVNEGSKLLKEGNKFIVINEREIYKIG